MKFKVDTGTEDLSGRSVVPKSVWSFILVSLNYTRRIVPRTGLITLFNVNVWVSF